MSFAVAVLPALGFMSLGALSLAALSVAAMSCGKPGQAEDPSQFIEQDFEHESESAEPPTPPENATDSPARATASEAECRRAAQHLVDLGVQLAIAAEADPEEKQRLREERPRALKSAEAKEHVRAFTAECLGKGTTKLEARCIAQARSEADIERCVPLD